MGTWLNLAQLAPETFDLLRVAPKTWLEGMFFSNTFSFSGFERPKDVYVADWTKLEQALRWSYATNVDIDDLDWNTADFEGEIPDEMERDPVWRASLGESALEGYEFNRGPAYWFSPATVAEMAKDLEAQHGAEANERLRRELLDAGIELEADSPHLAVFSGLGAFFSRAAALGRIVVGGISDRGPRG